MSERFAIYYTMPATDSLYQQAAAWLGYNVIQGETLNHPLPDHLAHCKSQVPGCTDKPSLYGFHGTLKAPFHLKAGTSLQALFLALEEMASATPAFECAPLSVNIIGQFLALQPDPACAELNQLAAACVKQFDTFRAHLTEQEFERRNKHTLTRRQTELLEQWGYPYVMDEFRFHMTLTEKLQPQQLSLIQQTLEEEWRELLVRPLLIDQLYLFYQPGKNLPFRVLKSFPLAD